MGFGLILILGALIFMTKQTAPPFTSTSFLPRPIPLQPSKVPTRGTGNYTRWIQNSLNTILDYNLMVDGIMGSRTKGAIQAFQAEMGLQVDGVVGPVTESSIKKSLAAGTVYGE